MGARPGYPDSDDPAAAIAAGELKFVLSGRKLRGRYVIIKTSGRKGRATATSGC